MFTSLALAASLTLSPAPTSAPEPLLRVTVGDLDFARADHVEIFITRVDAATRSFCAEHRAVVTPSHVGDRRFCETGMRGLVVRALPRPAWRAVVRSGLLGRRATEA